MRYKSNSIFFRKSCLFIAFLLSGLQLATAVTLTREDRLSPLTAGYLERAKIMLKEGNYAGVIDQLGHLDTQNVNLPTGEQEAYAYLLAISLYERGDAHCVELLNEFVSKYPASLNAKAAKLAAADYFFFSHKFSDALMAYDRIDYGRINPSDRPVYEYRKALSMIRCGLFDDAVPILEALRNEREFNLAADYYLAYCDYVKGKLEKAYKGFVSVDTRMGDERIDGLDPQYYLLQIDYAHSKYEEVISKGETLLRVSPVEELLPDTERLIGLSYFKTGQYDKAEKMLRKYLRNDGIDPASDAIYALGVIDYDKGELDLARDRFSAITDLDNDLAQSAYLYLGQIAVKEKDNNAAAISFEKASRMDYDPDVTEAAMFNYLAAKTHGGNIPFSSSISLLQDFLKKFPKSGYSSQVEEYLGAAYYNERDYRKALESINKIARPSAKVLAVKQKVLYELGVEAMAQNQPSEAKKYLKEGININGDQNVKTQSYLWLGDACYATGDYREAENAYLTYLKLDKKGENKTIARYNLAYSQLMQDKYRAAVDNFAASLKADPLLPSRLQEDALIRMADAQYYAGDYQIALKNYTTAIDNKAVDSDYATYRRAVMYGLGGDIQTKLRELSAMPSRFPDSKWLPDALLEKGQTYTALGETENAVAAFEQLRFTYKQSSQARKGMLNLAIAYMENGEQDKGNSTYKEIIKRWPTSEEAGMANDDLRRYYASTGGLQEYASFLRTIPEAPQLDANEMETLAFEGAETAFAENRSNLVLLEKYIEDYPGGRYLAQVLLDIAVGKDEAGEKEEALASLNSLLSRRGDSSQVPEALLLKARILEEKGEVSRKEALDTYRELEKRGGPEYIADACSGIMRTTASDEERMRYAGLVINSGGLSAGQLEEAEFYRAFSSVKKDGDKAAIKILEDMAANPKSLYGAKSAVELGQYYLNNGAVSDAERILTEFTETGSPHEYWLARGFIALADVYHKRGKDYLALEYIKSLKENYPGDEKDIQDMISTRLNKWKKRN